MRIAIVSHAKILVEHLRGIFFKVPYYKVVWVANNGMEAVKKAAAETPDLIIMDLDMPVMDGVELTKCIMKNSPCAILILTASVGYNTSKVFEAMGYGALDVVKTPENNLFKLSEETDAILRKIETIARLVGKAKGLRTLPTKVSKNYPKESIPPLLVIGASTGGPIALGTIISKFPKEFKFATIIVQHLDEQFSLGFASWLGERCALPVEIATNGMQPTAGKILLAGKNKHLVMHHNLTLEYTMQPTEIFYKPSVDVFFSSVAEYWPCPSIALLLTGMGSDGAKGLKALHEANWYTIAEHKNSCIVYGMPKAAIEMEAASDVFELNEIAAKILSYHHGHNHKGRKN